MQEYNQMRSPKSFNEIKQDKKYEKYSENFRNELDQISKLIAIKPKSIGGSEKEIQKKSPGKIDENKTRGSRGSGSPQQSLNNSSRQSFDSDIETRRKLIYGNQSYKEEITDPLNQSTVQSNNELFSMVFLNKPSYTETMSTATTFTKAKSFLKEETSMHINQFNLGKKLGSGKFGEVFMARHKKSGFMCAIKRIDKCNIDKKLIVQLVREIKIQSFLNHPNIVKLFSFFCDSRYIYLVEELCYSGQLYTFLKKKKKLPEDLTKNIVQQICRALDYMHECEIIHRDLKPENIIFHNGLIKICDFGWSISSKTMRQTFCGTPLYVSPELLKRKNYNNKIDVWSIGILTYELLYGKVPFDITHERDFIKIVEDDIKFSKATTVSNDGKDFILICLKKDPRDRYTVPELLEHPFIAHIENISISEMY